MRIALAQISPAPRDLLQRHIEQIALASARGCDLIAFPELSLTGYHPTDVTRAPSSLEDQQITKLEDACKTHGISAIVGAPLRQGAQVLIGALLISPGEATRWYAKRHLHEDEVPFFAEGMREPLFLCQGARVGLAICYELFVPQHRELLAALSLQLIIASVAKHTHGLERARGALAELARANKTPTLLVNAAGPCEGFVAAGGSCWFDANGERSVCLGQDPDVMIIDLPANVNAAR